MMFAGVAALSIVYGEIRLLTGSVWPAVLLHSVTFAAPLFLPGYITVAPSAEILVSPSPGSALSIYIYGSIGLALYRHRRSLRRSVEL